MQIKITDEAWIDGRIADIIPDHGKIMHLYLVNENYQQLCHLHPKRNSNDNSLFEVAIPPIEYGKYYIFIDVTLESGSNQTLKNIIEYYPENILNQNKQYFLEIDGDDSFIKEKYTGSSIISYGVTNIYIEKYLKCNNIYLFWICNS